MDPNNLPLLLVYGANVLVAGWISLTCLIYPKRAVNTVFSGKIAYSEGIRLIGALWGGVWVLSMIGLVLPQKMAGILLFQLVYKSTWLMFVALPAFRQKKAFPKGMAWFFLVWVLILPWVIPWDQLFMP